MNTAQSPSPLAPEMLDVETVRRVYCGNASARHVYRLADAGRMPWGHKLGSLRRWSRAELDDWVRGGCKPVRRPGRKESRP